MTGAASSALWGPPPGAPALPQTAAASAMPQQGPPLGVPQPWAAPGHDLPFDAGGAQRAQAGAQELRLLLERCLATQSSNPWWASLFWKGVADAYAGGRLDSAVMALMSGYGFPVVPPESMGPPRDDLVASLRSLEIASAAPHGSGGQGSAGGNFDISSTERWHTTLPPDLKRAATDIYKNIRACGSTTLREWLLQNFTGNKASHTWTDLWTLAAQLDFTIANASAPGEAAKLRLLATDDVVEIGLRRLASHVYETRTHDHAGAAAMLAVPSEATVFSKNEHQRDERVAAASKKPKKGEGKGTGKGKGKDKGKGAGTPAPDVI